MSFVGAIISQGLGVGNSGKYKWVSRLSTARSSAKVHATFAHDDARRRARFQTNDTTANKLRGRIAAQGK